MLGQLDDYVTHVRTHLGDYQECYERNIEQQHALGLPGVPSGPVRIGDEVSGGIVVTGYQGVARPLIAKLKQQAGNSVEFVPLYNVLWERDGNVA